jgi:hypothetical protein
MLRETGTRIIDWVDFMAPPRQALDRGATKKKIQSRNATWPVRDGADFDKSGINSSTPPLGCS